LETVIFSYFAFNSLLSTFKKSYFNKNSLNKKKMLEKISKEQV